MSSSKITAWWWLSAVFPLYAVQNTCSLLDGKGIQHESCKPWEHATGCARPHTSLKRRR